MIRRIRLPSARSKYPTSDDETRREKQIAASRDWQRRNYDHFRAYQDFYYATHNRRNSGNADAPYRPRRLLKIELDMEQRAEEQRERNFQYYRELDLRRELR